MDGGFNRFSSLVEECQEIVRVLKLEFTHFTKPVRDRLRAGVQHAEYLEQFNIFKGDCVIWCNKFSSYCRVIEKERGEIVHHLSSTYFTQRQKVESQAKLMDDFLKRDFIPWMKTIDKSRREDICRGLMKRVLGYHELVTLLGEGTKLTAWEATKTHIRYVYADRVDKKIEALLKLNDDLKTSARFFLGALGERLENYTGKQEGRNELYLDALAHYKKFEGDVLSTSEPIVYDLVVEFLQLIDYKEVERKIKRARVHEKKEPYNRLSAPVDVNYQIWGALFTLDGLETTLEMEKGWTVEYDTLAINLKALL